MCPKKLNYAAGDDLMVCFLNRIVNPPSELEEQTY